ncbi:MAG: DUF1707 domain-containing protein [Micromonosporaceae bacterium]|nr:DUF1707 domain-containing protein [Micromonosporaceae bacterium]
MSDDLVPRQPQLRMSDADRERIAERLRTATGEGRITLAEYEDRLRGVLAARTFADAEPYLADLPGGPVLTQPPEQGEVRTSWSSLKRRGAWLVPRRLTVSAVGGSVVLDLTEAVIPQRVVEIELDVNLGSTTIVLPAGATADIDSVVMTAGSAHVRRVATTPVAGPGLHVVVRGKQRLGSLTVRQKRRFLWWRW